MSSSRRANRSANKNRDRQPGRRQCWPWIFCRPRLEELEDRTLLTMITWINPSGGDWATPGNWSTGPLPGPGDDVVIDISANITITHSSGTDSIHSLTSRDALALSGGTLSIAASSKIGNTFTLTGGTLAGP